MGLALAKTIEIEDIEQREEGDIQYYYLDGRKIAYDIFEYANEDMAEICGAILHTCLLRVKFDYYSFYYGRPKTIWKKPLLKHVANVREACELIIEYRLIHDVRMIPNYIFEDDPVSKNSLTFPRLEALIFGLLFELKKCKR